MAKDTVLRELESTRNQVSKVRDAVDKLYLQPPYILSRSQWEKMRDILNTVNNKTHAEIMKELGA